MYDKIGLLKPLTRTDARYRQYGENELLRLQQILFYKEMDFQLKDIKRLMDDPDFDLVRALCDHKAAILLRRDRLDVLINTINQTINHLNNKTMANYHELYEGLPKEQAAAMRHEAIEKWGEVAIVKSEEALLKMPRPEQAALKADQADITNQLKFKFLAGESPEDEDVQIMIRRHYNNIRGFWNVGDEADLRAKAYKGLGDLYVNDERYTATKGKPDPQFALFMCRAINFFADTQLH